MSGAAEPVTEARGRLRFAITFALIAAVLFVVYAFPYAENGVSESWFDGYLALYARVAGTVLSVFDSRVTVHQQDILGAYNLRIVKNCDAMEANILYASAVLAFPVRPFARVTGLLVGLVLLVSLNVLRICSLYFIGIFAPGTFEFFHLELWPLLLIAAGACIFLVWARHSASQLSAEPAHAPA